MNKDNTPFDRRALASYFLQFLVIGHRGAAGLAPENTLPSFRKALDMGCQGVELDVHAVNDAAGEQQLVLILVTITIVTNTLAFLYPAPAPRLVARHSRGLPRRSRARAHAPALALAS